MSTVHATYSTESGSMVHNMSTVWFTHSNVAIYSDVVQIVVMHTVIL